MKKVCRRKKFVYPAWNRTNNFGRSWKTNLVVVIFAQNPGNYLSSCLERFSGLSQREVAQEEF